eukprot:3940452-Rhodomonas_salina.2
MIVTVQRKQQAKWVQQNFQQNVYSNICLHVAVYTVHPQHIQTYSPVDFHKVPSFLMLGEDKGISSLMSVLEEYAGDVNFLRDAASSRQKQWRGASGDIAGNIELFLVTAHKAKGMEFVSIMLSTDFESRLPVFGDGLMPKASMNASVVEELNILYVAVTRARQGAQCCQRKSGHPEHWDNLVASWDESVLRFSSGTLVSLSDIQIPSTEMAAIREGLTTWLQLACGLINQGAHKDI